MLNYIHLPPPSLTLSCPLPHLVSMFCLMFAHFRLLVFGCKFIWLPRGALCSVLKLAHDFFMVHSPAPSPYHFLFADNMFARIAATINCPGQIVGSVAASVRGAVG